MDSKEIIKLSTKAEGDDNLNEHVRLKLSDKGNLSAISARKIPCNGVESLYAIHGERGSG
jgi:hypothetical protein